MNDVPPEIEARLVTKGFQDKDVLEGRLRTDAPTLPNDVMNLQLTMAQTLGHTLEQGDVEAAFLNSPLMKREVYLRVPRGGLPAVDNHRAMQAGEILKCKRSVYGFNDAPGEWHGEHRRGILECGAQASSLCPTLYFWYENDKLKGTLGTHVDDDLMHFGDDRRAKYTKALQQRFP